MMPGNAMVYMNAKEFGEGRKFPHDIGGSSYSMSNDALGGYHGDDVAKLVEIRNTHGRGNFQERWIDDAFNPNGFSNIYIYERRELGDRRAQQPARFRLRPADARADRALPPNTVLVELTGNAADPTVDPGGNIPRSDPRQRQRPGDDPHSPNKTDRTGTEGLRHLRPGDAAGHAFAHQRVPSARRAQRQRRPTTARRGWPTST